MLLSLGGVVVSWSPLPSQDPGVPSPQAGLALAEARASNAVFVGRGRAPILQRSGEGCALPAAISS